MTKFNVEETFNPEEYLYFYRNMLTFERTQKEIDFLVKHTQLNYPLEILDLACGHGRHSNLLAHLGHSVTGIDVTEGFLKLAQKEAVKLHVRVNYHQQDMRDLNYENSFDRVYALYTAIGYFDDPQNEKVFRNIYAALKPGGMFCFDSHNRDTYLTYAVPSSITEIEGNFMIDEHSFDTLTGLNTTRRTVLYKGAKKTFNFSVRFYNPTELSALFKAIGFSNITFYENWEGKQISQNCKRMIVTTQK